MNTRDKPTLKGQKVALRPLGGEDADAAFEMVTDEENPHLTGTQATFTREQTARWYSGVAAQEGRIDLAIVSRETGEFLGEVVLNDIDELNRSASFRIGLKGASQFGRGYGSEAARLMLGYGFGTFGLNRIGLEVFAFNPRAIHVYEKLGFKREGVLREVLYADGDYHDAIVMSLLRREYLAQRLG